MTLFLNAVVTGLAIGGVYGLIGIGYAVVFSATRVFNLAQGDLVMVGVMLSYLFLEVEHWPQIVAFVLVLLCVTAISLVEEQVIVRPFLRRRAENIGWFIATLAFGLVLETVATRLYGEHPPQAIHSFLPTKAVRVGSISTTPQLLLAFLVLVAVTVAVEVLYKRTWVGQAMRGTAEDREIAALRGISPARMSRIAFLLGGVIAAVSGFVVAPIVYADVTIGLTYSIKGFVALAIGGFGSLRGAVVGALVLGVGEQIFDLYVSPRYEVLAALLLLLLILAVRPMGLFGDRKARTV